MSASCEGLLLVFAVLLPSLVLCRIDGTVFLESLAKPVWRELELRAGVPQRFKIWPNATILLDANNTELYLEWRPVKASSTARVALLASNGTTTPEIVVSGELPGEGNGALRSCTWQYPCTIADSWDKASFYARPGYAFVRLPPPLVNASEVVLQLFEAERKTDVSISGHLVVRTRKTDDEKLICGGRDGKVCGGVASRCLPNAESDAGECKCGVDRGGRFCEEPMVVWRCSNVDERVSDLPLQLDAGEWKYVRYVHCGKEGSVQLEAKVDRSAEVELYAKLDEQSCNFRVPVTAKGVLPSGHDIQCKAESFVSRLQRNSDFLIGTLGYWDIALHSETKTRVILQLRSCDAVGCSTPSAVPLRFIPILAGAAVIGSIGVFVIVMLRRRNKANSNTESVVSVQVDRISIDEPPVQEEGRRVGNNESSLHYQ